MNQDGTEGFDLCQAVWRSAGALVPPVNRAGFAGDSNTCVGWSIIGKTTNKYFPKLHERAVHMVLANQDQHESRWLAILSISSKIGCAPQTLNEWVKKVEVDSGGRCGVPTEAPDKMNALERENREQNEANEILLNASAHFAQRTLGQRLYLCHNVARVRLRRLRHQRICPTHRRLAREPHSQCGACFGCPEASHSSTQVSTGQARPPFGSRIAISVDQIH